eukprot:3971153-Alexandrium_andersonii.AAC.1
MSASLVGSEMCIRDRLIFVSSSACQPGAKGVATNGYHSFLRFPAPPRGCLLYTSDAADDM